MWEIYEHRKVVKQLKGAPSEILKRYEKWKDIVMLSGPQGLRLIRGFPDEPLKGEWAGHRASRLSAKYRVIYQVIESDIRVLVMQVTSHDYRKK